MTKKDIYEYIIKLGEDEREALEIASLIGKQFSLDYILDLSEIKPSKLLELFDKMIKLNFLHENLNIGKGTYEFISKKVSTDIVKSIDNDKKHLYMTRIIDYMEHEFKKDNNKSVILAELLVKHEVDGDSFIHKKRAADLLLSANKIEAASEVYKEVINSILSCKRDDLKRTMLVDSVISYAGIAINNIPPDELLPVIINTLPIAKRLNNKRAQAIIEVCIGRLYQKKGDLIEASKHFNNGWKISENTNDHNLEKKMSKFMAISLFWQGMINEAVSVYEKTIDNVEDISTDLDEFWSYLMLAYCYGLAGRITRGIGLAEALKERALSNKMIKYQAYAEAVISLILLEVRQIEKACPHIDNALNIGNKIGNHLVLWMAEPCRAYELYLKGDLPGAKDFLISGIRHAKCLGQIDHPSPWILDILWALHIANLEPIQGYSFASEITRIKGWPNAYMKGVALRYEAIDSFRNRQDSKHIEMLLLNSVELLKKSGAKIELNRTHIELAKLFVWNNEINRAKKFAKKSFEFFRDIDEQLFPSELSFLIQNKSEKTRLLKGITELGNIVDGHSSIDNYLERVITILTDMFRAERAAVLLTDIETGEPPFSIAASRNFCPAELVQFKNEPLQTIIRSTLEKKEAIVINNPGKQFGSTLGHTHKLFDRSLACIPLIIKRESVGLIYLDNRFFKGAFSEKDLMLITAISYQLSSQLESVMKQSEASLADDSLKYFSSEPNVIETEVNSMNIIGNDKAFQRTLLQIDKVSKTDATVLILGETGAGKELFAKAIHQKSNRSEEPLISVNISALSENLLQSELFGHEKGAFTGADKTRIGRFEIAHRGTIFLDEIGDLSQESQVKLLRVLQEGEFERVGGSQTIRSNFRLIAATNRNLHELIACGKFRSDLYYRLCTFPIKIPPLRERKGDIKNLVLYFLHKYASKHRKQIKRIHDDEIKKLMAYSWPGNVRELEHVIERGIILAEGENLVIKDFETVAADIKENRVEVELLSLDEIMRKHIINVLNHTKWKIRGEQGAAKILGLNPSTLDFRINKLDIKK